MAQRIKLFLLNNGPLLTTITIFILVYVIGGRLYPAMQKPQVFFNLFINTASFVDCFHWNDFCDPYQGD